MIYVIITALVYLLDQITKTVFFEKNGIVLIKNVLSINYCANSGAAYGLLKDAKIGQALFTVLTVIFLVLIIVFYLKSNRKHPFLHTSLAFIIGGTLGNFVDRLSLKYVRDFIELNNFLNIKLFNFLNFTCNVADIFLCVGAVMVVIYILFLADKDEKHTPKKEEADA